MIRIFQDVDLSLGQRIMLDKDASNHLLRVLRLKTSHTFNLFNGKGGEYIAQLEIDGKHAIAILQSYQPDDFESPLQIHLYQGISKGDRMDFAIQKSVELGVTSITPVFCQRTVVNLKSDRLDKKQQHWQSVAISACEQSGRNRIPVVNSAIDISRLFSMPADHLRITLDPQADSALTDLKPDTSKPIDILIGPEGGLTDDEIHQSLATGFTAVKFGPRILRTETAALAAITSAQVLWGDLGRK